MVIGGFMSHVENSSSWGDWGRRKIRSLLTSTLYALQFWASGPEKNVLRANAPEGHVLSQSSEKVFLRSRKLRANGPEKNVLRANGSERLVVSGVAQLYFAAGEWSLEATFLAIAQLRCALGNNAKKCAPEISM